MENCNKTRETPPTGLLRALHDEISSHLSSAQDCGGGERTTPPTGWQWDVGDARMMGGVFGGSPQKTNHSMFNVIFNEPQPPGRDLICLIRPPSAASGLVSPLRPVNTIQKQSKALVCLAALIPSQQRSSSGLQHNLRACVARHGFNILRLAASCFANERKNFWNL